MTQAVIPFRQREDLDVQTLGQIFAQSGFFEDSRQAAQAVTKILAGRELGLGPVASMTGIYIVKGKVSLSSNVIAGLIKRGGRYDYRVKRLDGEGCVLVFTQDGRPVGESSFTAEDARAAGLWGQTGPWKQFPRNMLFARALTNGARWYCADIFAGPIYTPEELGAVVDAETGEVVGRLEPSVSDVSETGALAAVISPPSSGRALSIAKIRGKEGELRDLGVAVAEVDLERLTADELRARAGALHQLALDLGAFGWREIAAAAIAAGAEPIPEDIEPGELAVEVANWRGLLAESHAESPVEPDDLPF